MKRKMWLTWLVVVSLATVGLVAAGCGGSDDSNSNEGGESANQDYSAVLKKLYDGDYSKPTGDPVKAPSGQNIWVISAGQSLTAGEQTSAAIKEAGDKLGWDVTIFDGKFDPNEQLNGVNQAIADQADGIVFVYIDCPSVRNGLDRAKDEGVKTVAIQSADCSDIDSSDPARYDWVTHYSGNRKFIDWISDFARAQADWTIAQNDGQAKLILTVQNDFEVGRIMGRASAERYEECDGCEIVKTVEFTGDEYGPPLQQKIEQALIQNPDANAIIGCCDAVYTSGGAAALMASGRMDEIAKAGSEGGAAGIELIRENRGMDSCVGAPPAWDGYGAVDAMIRLLDGDSLKGVNNGIGIQVCDREHNLPPEGEGFQGPFDFVAEFDQKWGIN